MSSIPTSSSPVTSRVTPSRDGSEASACSAMARPHFMSKHPGPRRMPSATTNGCVASEPSGHTVSWWASTSTLVSPPSRQRRWVTPSMTIRSGSEPSSSAPIPATTSAERATAAWSADGDSHSTSRRMSSSIAGRTSGSLVTMVMRLRASGWPVAPKWTYSSPVGSE